MNNSKPRILLISANASIIGTRRLTYDYYRALVQYGCPIDLLLKDQADIQEEHIFFNSLEKQKEFEKRNYIQYFKRIKVKVWTWLHPYKVRKPYYFFYEDENHPPFNVDLILEKIYNKYDFVIISNWEDFIGAKAIEAIYDKLHVPILLLPPDWCAITGGCHYFYDCRGFMKDCSNCPGTKKRFTSKNLLERKRIWDKTNLIITGNDYMAHFYKKSFLYRDKSTPIIYVVVDENIFCPQDASFLRNQLNIPLKYKYILSFGAQVVTDPRKGISYLIESLELLYNMLSLDERSRVLLLIAGNAKGLEVNKLHFDYNLLGHLDVQQLADMYAVSDLFLCPSIEDAGPMMVNQSLSCGTPVVAFETGVALNVVKGKGTGAIAKMKDSKSFADGIYRILKQNETDKLSMRKKCREIALNTTSFRVVAEDIVKLYNSLDLSLYK